MRHACLVLLIILYAAVPLFSAQAQGNWCGYALIEGLPVLENQLAVIAAITPTRHTRSLPHELFQYRYNLAHTAVIIEGCFDLEPKRDLVVTLLAQAVDVIQPTPEPKEDTGRPGDAIELPAQPIEIAEPVTPEQYVDSKLVYSLFAPGGTREESAASVRAYLQANIRDWEEPVE